jgi:hypothetical protein
LALVFFGVTILLYAVLGAFDWQPVIRALCAMALGPVLSVGGIALWWQIRRPQLAPDIEESDHPAARTEPNRPTLLLRPDDAGSEEDEAPS